MRRRPTDWRETLQNLLDERSVALPGRDGEPGDAAGLNPALVQNAGNRMFWASHCKDDSDQDDNENECDGDDSQLAITEVSDSGTQAEVTKRDVDRFEVLPRGQGACPLLVVPPSDPCRRPKDAVLTGYRSGGEVGWLWHVKQGATSD